MATVTLVAAQPRTTRRQRAGVLNRRIGWMTVPVIGASSILHNTTNGDASRFNDLITTLNWVGIPMTLVHVALAIYVFGFFRPQPTLRVLHIWFSYLYLAFMVAAIASFRIEPLHTYLVLGMYLCLIVHVLMSMYFGWRRTGARAGNAPY